MRQGIPKTELKSSGLSAQTALLGSTPPSTTGIRNSSSKDIIFDGGRWWIVRGRTTTPWHVVFEWDGCLYCTCLGFLSHGNCRHVKMISRFYKAGTNHLFGGSNMGKIEVRTGYKFVDELVGRPLKNDVVYAVYGESQVGKTLTTMHLAYAISEKLKAMGEPANILFVDTEGGLEEFIEAWEPKLRSRFDAGEVHVEVRRTIFSVMKLHGVSIDFKTSDKGKMTMILKGIEFDAPINKIVRKNKIGVIVYDSLTAPLRIFPSAQENFPVRSDVTGLLLTRILDVIEEFGPFVFMTHHVTLNPANPYDKPGMRGGSIVKYLSKAIFYIDRAGKGSAGRGKKANYRKFWLVRWFDKPEWGAMTWFKITDVGVEDVSEKEIESVMKRR